MEVQRIENFKIPNAVTHEITQEELQRDFDYYRAQKVLETMFMFGMISVDEFHKISAINRKTFSPLHIAKLIGRVCEAKRPHSVSERPARALS